MPVSKNETIPKIIIELKSLNGNQDLFVKSCNDKNSSFDCIFTESEIANAVALKTEEGSLFLYSSNTGLSDTIEFQV